VVVFSYGFCIIESGVRRFFLTILRHTLFQRAVPLTPDGGGYGYEEGAVSVGQYGLTSTRAKKENCEKESGKVGQKQEDPQTKRAKGGTCWIGRGPPL